MQTTYGERLAIAREHAGYSQAELARRVGVKPQAVQYLEEKKNHARGSRLTPQFARACGVDAIWIETGEGTMLAKDRANEPPADYALDRPRDLAAAIAALRPELRRAVGQLVAALAGAAQQNSGRQYSLTAGEASAGTMSARPLAQRPARRKRAA